MNFRNGFPWGPSQENVEVIEKVEKQPVKQRHLVDVIFFGVAFIALVFVAFTHWATISRHLLARPVGAIIIGLGIISGVMLVDIVFGRRSFRG